MADRIPKGDGDKKARLLRAKPLEEPPRPIPVDVPPSPVPLTVPPAPIPVGRVAAPIPRPAPGPSAPKPRDPASPAPSSPTAAPAAAQPIPAGAAAGTGAKARPIAVGGQKPQKSEPRITPQRSEKATGLRKEVDEAAEQGEVGVLWQRILANQPAWLVSLVVHMVALVVLAMCMITYPKQRLTIMSPPEPETPDFGELSKLEVEDLKQGPEALDIVDRDTVDSLEPKIDLEHATEGLNAATALPQPFFSEIAPLNDHFFEEGRGTGIAHQRGTGKGEKGTGWGLAGKGKGLGGRGGRRGQAVGRGATPESEKAVNLALEWLANHQLPDGGWSFDHTVAASCHAQCANPGEKPVARIAATALGVLPFLGAGQTHQVGQYQKTVRAGLAYLMARMQVRPEGGSLWEEEGRMYAHGLATIALCEAYAMRVNPKDVLRPRKIYDGTESPPSPSDIASLRDKQEANKQIAADNEFNAALGRAAQLALNYVSYAQDPGAGGWRYMPRQAGDTSVVGWQVMALKSGQMAELIVNPATLAAAEKYLESVKIGDYGDNYGYTDSTKGSEATQAIGLLCRMYLGWPREHAGLKKGVEALDARGPSQGNMYFNYYATQVMHHAGGDPWKRWNDRMRDFLVNRQSKAGHEAGSWYFGGDHGSSPGGRLYITALAAMTLEVYYRHMPLYRQDIFGDEKDQPAADAGGAKREKPDTDAP